MLGTALVVGALKGMGTKAAAAKVIAGAAAKKTVAKAAASKFWIKAAIKHPGQLHRDLGIPLGKKIPKTMIKAAAKNPAAYVAKHNLTVSPVKLGQRARLALVLAKMRKA